MQSNHQFINYAPLTADRIDALLKDPSSWLFQQQQNALDERLRLTKELIKQEHRLAYNKEIDDRIAEQEADEFLKRQMERARVQSLDEYAEEQRQLASKIEKMYLTTPDYFSLLLTRQADLARTANDLNKQYVALTGLVEGTQHALQDVQEELKAVTDESQQAKAAAQQARSEISDQFNGNMTIGEQTVSLSANTLPEETQQQKIQKKRVLDYRVGIINEVVEKFNDGSLKDEKGDIRGMQYYIMIAPAFLDVLGEQKVQSSVKKTYQAADLLLPAIIKLATTLERYRVLNQRREELNKEEARQLKKLEARLIEQKELLRKIVSVKAEASKIKEMLVAHSSFYSNTNLIAKFGVLEQQGNEKQKNPLPEETAMSYRRSVAGR